MYSDTVSRYADKLEEIGKKVDSLNGRFDSLTCRSKVDEFEEARHPRNAGGIFTKGEGEEGKEDTQMEHGSLSKRNLEST